MSITPERSARTGLADATAVQPNGGGVTGLTLQDRRLTDVMPYGGIPRSHTEKGGLVSEVPITSRLASDAVHIDLSSKDTATQGLLNVGELTGKILFYREGDNYFAVEARKGPTLFQNRLCAWFNPKVPHYANDEVGAKLAEHFDKGLGKALQDKMNYGWFKVAVDSKEVSRTVDENVFDLEKTLSNFLDFRCGGQMSHEIFTKCKDSLTQIRDRYQRREVGYAKTMAALERIRTHYQYAEGKRQKDHPGENLQTEKGLEPLSWPPQTAETMSAVSERLKSCLNEEELGEIKRSGLARKDMVESLDNCQDIDLGPLARRHLNRARVVNRTRELDGRVKNLRNENRDRAKETEKRIDSYRYNSNYRNKDVEELIDKSELIIKDVVERSLPIELRIEAVKYCLETSLQLDELEAIRQEVCELEELAKQAGPSPYSAFSF